MSTSRPSGSADHRRQARYAGGSPRRQGQPAFGRHRACDFGGAEVDRSAWTGVLAIDDGQWLRGCAYHQFGRRARHRRAQQVDQGPRIVVARGHRPVAPGFDCGRDRDAGNQQDPAHRYGRAVRAPARGQHPAAGSADRRPTTTSTRSNARWSPRGGFRRRP